MPRIWMTLILAISFLLILAACNTEEESSAPARDPATPATTASPESSEQERGTLTEDTASSEETEPELDRNINFSTAGWETDFSQHSVSLSEISSGGPPRDGIPPIDHPQFVSPMEAEEWLGDLEPVISVEIEGDARAYPLQIMIWHEIANDEVNGIPVAVTFCPLCNTAITFDRRVDDLGTLRFGTTGNLRHSDLVMWDDLTESWWQQITGEAIVGELTGTTLEMLPASIVSFEQFRETFSDGIVLSRETGFRRDYGRNPYMGYDNVDQSPFLFDGPSDDRLPPMMRVVTVTIGDEDVAYSFDDLAEHGVIEDTVGGETVVVFWNTGTTSALDSGSIADSRDIGATGVFDPVVDGQHLTFIFEDGVIRDEETSSTWNVLGQAIDGPLQGKQLTPVVHGNHFFFAWAVFKPETRVWEPPE